MLLWVDEVVILDHASTDRTPEIISEVAAENPGRVHAFRDDNPEWQEMRHRQFLLDEARKLGATHVVLCDSDEVLTGNLLPTIRSLMPAPGTLLQLPWACLARGIDRYYTSGVWFNNWVSTAFVDQPWLGWSSAGRGGYDFHHRHPMGRHMPTVQPVKQKQGGLMHLQFVDERRLRAKQALYQVTEHIRWPGRETPAQLAYKYGRAVYESDPSKYSTEACPAEWWAPYAHLMKHLELGGEPWQLASIRSAIAEQGIERFKSLALFGTEKM
jgi:hypothetical protein